MRLVFATVLLASSTAFACWDALVVRLERLCISLPGDEPSPAGRADLASWALRFQRLVPEGARASIDFDPYLSACQGDAYAGAEGGLPLVTWCDAGGCRSQAAS